jgi:septum formation protein
LILASASSGRASVLQRAGIDFQQVVSGVDEDVLKVEAAVEKCMPEQIAIRLAVAKAKAVSQQHPKVFVIGADQILECRGQLFDKPKNLKEALAHLNIFQGTSHQLISAVTLTLDGKTLWTHAEIATLTMRTLKNEDLERYLKRSGPEVLESVGVYRLEGIGATLFDKIDGDYFTILGLPLLPLLACLREHKVISS